MTIIPLRKISRNPLFDRVVIVGLIILVDINIGFARAASSSTIKPSPAAAIDLVKVPQSLNKYNKTTTINDQLDDDLDLFSILNYEQKESNNGNSNKGSSTLNNLDSKNKTYVSTVESFRVKHKFNLIDNHAKHNSTINDTIQLSLPRWFDYELYKSKYNKNYSNLNGSDQLESKRKKIYLQTALKVLDYRARFRANKTSSLVFINELSDLTNDDILEITSTDRSATHNDSSARKDNCCSYDEAIKKIKLYHQLSDEHLRRAIIDEISEKPMPIRGGLDERKRAKKQDKAVDQQQFPFSKSVYYSKYKQSYHNNYNYKYKPTTRTTTTTTTTTTASPLDSVELTGQQQINDTVRLQIEEALKSYEAALKFGDISIDNNTTKVKQEPATWSPTVIYENKTLARTDSHKEDKDVATIVSGGDKLNNTDIDKGLWATNKGLAAADSNSELFETELASQSHQKVAGKNNGSLETGSEDDTSYKDNFGKRNNGAVTESDGLLESNIQQAIQDQIVEQMKSQMGEQLRQTFSEHFGRPVMVRPMQFFTATTTPFPEGVLPSFIQQTQQKQQSRHAIQSVS